MKHYKYGSSTAHRTINCPAWRQLADKMPPTPVGQAAVDGTAMHAVFERAMLDQDFDPDAMVGLEVEGVIFTDEMADKVWQAVELQDEFKREHNLQVSPEQTLVLNENIGGTADLIGINRENNIIAIGDLKTGDGNMIQAENNSQLLFCAYLYLRTALPDDFEIDGDTRFLLYIIQPSERRSDPFDLWETDLRTVLEWGETFEAAVRQAEQGMPAPVAGAHCKFCPAETICPAKQATIENVARLKADSMELKQLNEALAIVDEVEDWCRAVRKLAHEQAEEGVRLEGWKLVDKRATRQWLDAGMVEDIARNKLKLRVKDIMAQKLLTPAQLEKVCKKLGKDFDELNDYVTMHSSGTTLAHADDPRPEATPRKAFATLAERMKGKS